MLSYVFWKAGLKGLCEVSGSSSVIFLLLLSYGVAISLNDALGLARCWKAKLAALCGSTAPFVSYFNCWNAVQIGIGLVGT